jgi:hypothetical protein
MMLSTGLRGCRSVFSRPESEPSRRYAAFFVQQRETKALHDFEFHLMPVRARPGTVLRHRDYTAPAVEHPAEQRAA